MVVPNHERAKPKEKIFGLSCTFGGLEIRFKGTLDQLEAYPAKAQQAAQGGKA